MTCGGWAPQEVPPERGEGSPETIRTGGPSSPSSVWLTRNSNPQAAPGPVLGVRQGSRTNYSSAGDPRVWRREAHGHREG